ncbi:transcription factor bHLH144-like [Phragmites australis]|nr:transcription factor bHLH144-like [Phragmites australis]XP_062223429.1 transcription factor bHLH144-like [Phragmites australis]XP_062223430.1 transcription factor bHLH144-like [Phragmites australis]XP_062223431.1 transcription factor bHLH144-like [Phragmites australis]
MQGGHGYYGGRDSPPQGYGYGYGGYGYDAGGYSSAGGYCSNGYPSAAPTYEDPLVAGRRAHDFPAPLNGLELQPSETCPKNYVIFDQTCTKSRVMFHPSLAHKLGGSSACYGGGGDAHDVGKGAYRDNNDYDDSCSVRQKEDTDEIDALLSSEDGDEDDVVSTGRTPGYRDGTSPDSTCSSSYGGGGGKPRPKKDRMKKMMRTLKGIIPGGNQMDTPAVLDEAVRYLKSLKVEAKKLGVRGSDS